MIEWRDARKFFPESCDYIVVRKRLENGSSVWAAGYYSQTGNVPDPWSIHCWACGMSCVVYEGNKRHYLERNDDNIYEWARVPGKQSDLWSLGHPENDDYVLIRLMHANEYWWCIGRYRENRWDLQSYEDWLQLFNGSSYEDGCPEEYATCIPTGWIKVAT